MSDLRAADLALGGQGAPMTPLADYVMYARQLEGKLAVINLGGFCNYTTLPADKQLDGIYGADVCVCNQFLDAIIAKAKGLAYDRDGECASSGKENDECVQQLYQSLKAQSEQGRSLGTGDELFTDIPKILENISCEDFLKSACRAIAKVVAEQISTSDRAIIAGGGAMNLELLRMIRSECSFPVDLSDEFHVPIDYRESTAMAVLGALCEDGVPITLPQVTGVSKAPLSGVWVRP